MGAEGPRGTLLEGPQHVVRGAQIEVIIVPSKSIPIKATKGTKLLDMLPPLGEPSVGFSTSLA